MNNDYDNKGEIEMFCYDEDIADEVDSIEITAVDPQVINKTFAKPITKYKKKSKVKEIKEKKNTKERLNKKSLLNEEIDKQIKTFFKMECEVCGIGFISYLEAKRHYRQTHKQAGYISCCGRKFFRRFKILDHIMKHTNPCGHLR